MREKITTILKRFNSIEPDSDFRERSLTIILANPQKNFSVFPKKIFDFARFTAALSLTSLLIISVFGGLSIMKKFSPAALSTLDTNGISKEINELDIHATLLEAKYYDNSLNKVAAVLIETAKSADNLNPSVIEKEIRELENLQLDNKTLDDILNELIL